MARGERAELGADEEEKEGESGRNKMTKKRERKREPGSDSRREGDDWKVRGMDDKLMSASMSISTIHT